MSAVVRFERWALGGIVALFGTAYALYGLFRHWQFGSSASDLGIFDQAVWHLSRFEAPAGTISGFTNILGDHFYPVIALFAPLYWLSAGPEMLIAAQAALFAASIVPVFLFIRSRLPGGPALGFAIAYGCFWGIQRAAAFDVHEMAFSPLVIAAAMLAVDRQKWVLFWVLAAMMLLIKEDHIPLVGAFGIYLLIRSERRRGVIAMATSVAAAVVVVGKSDSPNHWGTVCHYSAPLAPIVAMGAADGLARVARHLNEPAAQRLVTGLPSQASCCPPCCQDGNRSGESSRRVTTLRATRRQWAAPSCGRFRLTRRSWRRQLSSLTSA